MLNADSLRGGAMNLEKRKPTGREKDKKAIEQLEGLREQLHSKNNSTARRAGFQLSWMQEDGLEILAEALLGDTDRHIKNAACYGLRNMHGRMKSISRKVIERGAKSDNRTVREACLKAIDILEGRGPKSKPPQRHSRSKYKIKDYSKKKKHVVINHESPRFSRGNKDNRFNR